MSRNDLPLACDLKPQSALITGFLKSSLLFTYLDDHDVLRSLVVLVVDREVFDADLTEANSVFSTKTAQKAQRSFPSVLEVGNLNTSSLTLGTSLRDWLF
jgi:hypothetical protein